MESKPRSVRVLVVEDDSLACWSITESLVQAGCEVHEAGDGASAIAAIGDGSRPFDVVLLDYYMPDSADLRLLATVRRLAPDTAVVMMTAYGTPEITQEAIRLGARQVLQKPFDMHEIAAVVRRAIMPSS